MKSVLSERLLMGVVLSVGLMALVAAESEWKAPARAARKSNPVPLDTESIARGKPLYEKECFSCHGAKGEGNGPAAADLTKNPGNLSSAEFWKQTDGALFWKITEGNKPMPTFEKLFSENQRWDVVNYLHTFAPKESGKQPK